MRQFQLHFLLFLFASFCSLPLFGQKDILNGIFEQEAPVFFAEVKPTEKAGEAELTFYFTHSKLSNLEVSFWIKDLGTSLQSKGQKEMIRGLKEIGNRQREIITINGLSDQHFYTIGADYRNPKSLNRKFSSKVLQESFRYDLPIAKTAQNVQTQAPRTASRPSEETTTAGPPCANPDVNLVIEPSGYCAKGARPALMIQCANCQGKKWEFSLEVRGQWEDWRSLRADGRRQTAFGVSPRTEPFCTLAPGAYYVRVKSWGENCETPLINNLNTTVVVGNPQASAKTRPPVINNEQIANNLSKKSPVANIPDTCHVAGRAALVGETIRGTLRLESYSPCQTYQPYAKVIYVHPAHRDITLDMVPLRAGESTPFTIRLDDQDLNRGIHTIQVITNIKPDPSSESIALGSFWLKAEPENQTAAGDLFNSPAPPPAPPGYYSKNSPKPNATSEYEKRDQLGANPSNSPKEEKVDDPYASSISEDIDMINVKATDPNCTSIQDLQLVYSANQPNQPLYISWLSPRCCQEDGCDYTVWAGVTPQKMRLLVSGNKSGAMIREIMQGIQYNDEYFEVAVKTSNGTRKAAYLLGKGPIYGVEEVLAYHDQFNPQKSDPFIVKQEEAPEDKLTADKDGAVFELEETPPVVYESPSMPIDNFIPCKYKRNTTVQVEQPVLVGDEISIQYDFDGAGYKYSLYHLPDGADEWVLAPGVQELQDKARFDFRVPKEGLGKYLVLTYSPSRNWGCLSSSKEEPVVIKVEK